MPANAGSGGKGGSLDAMPFHDGNGRPGTQWHGDCVNTAGKQRPNTAKYRNDEISDTEDGRR